jgi:hypothetical protein
MRKTRKQSNVAAGFVVERIQWIVVFGKSQMHVLWGIIFGEIHVVWGKNVLMRFVMQPNTHLSE